MADYIVHKAIEMDALSAKVKATLPERRWIISPKYDGCHVVFLFDNNKHTGTFSRSGEVVLSMNHVGQDLLNLYPFLELGKHAICGEAWACGKLFNEISGMFRRHSPQLDLHFVPFDHVTYSGEIGFTLHSTEPYINRISSLSLWPSEVYGTSIVDPFFYELEGDWVNILHDANTRASHYKCDNIDSYDGVVLAHADGQYNVGSGKNGEFLKIKPLLSYTVTVTGADLDFGTKTGKNTASLKFMLDGLEQKVSTGLTQAQVEEITAVGWVGYRIEVEAMGKTIKGYLREPRFKGIRTDA